MKTWRWYCAALAILGYATRLLAGEPATAVATVTAGFVTSITLTSGGSGYVSEPTVTLTGGGGSGATAKAVLAGDKVALIILLNAGSGYTASPAVAIEIPPKPLATRLELVPKLTVEGPVGSLARVESGLTLNGPWEVWTNVTVGRDGVVLVDLRVAAAARFYRTIAGWLPAGFFWIPPGTFVMGSPATEPDRDSDEVQHTVTLTQGLWMSDHEVTQSEYQLLMGSNPSRFKSADLPVDSVTWDEAVLYCQKLTEQDRAAGRITAQQAYRLPTEAEWEYAARAGTTGPRYGELDAIAWYNANSGNQTHAVKQKSSNAWGLYDLIGNLWEYCSDWYGDYPAGSAIDPTGLVSGSKRVVRGGSWGNTPKDSRSANRDSVVSGPRYESVGFRLVLSSVR